MKNKIKILFLFISVIFISLPAIVSAEKVYYYEILLENNVIDEIGGYKKIDECNVFRVEQKKIFSQDTTEKRSVGDCKEKEISEAPKEVVDVTAKENQPIGKYKSTYTLLAPIGDFKEFKTDDIGKYFNILVKLAIGLCGALAVIMIIINGVMYMGEGSIFKKAQAKDGITDAIIGLLIALGSWAILNTINPDLLGGSGLSIRAAKLDVNMEVHGDKPQNTGKVKSKDCAGRITLNSETAPNGIKWSEDKKEREELIKYDITVQRKGPSCENSGKTDCTSLTGLDTSKVIEFKTKICPSCEVVINGGTECWLHSPNTQHFPGNSIVDFDDTPSMTKYVESGKNLGKTKTNDYSMYEKDGIQFLDEGNHYHIIKW